jgi:SAM-dependent methyltransferase
MAGVPCQPGAGRSGIQSPWYESFFGRDYLDVYAHQFNEQLARKEAGFALRALDLKAGTQVLDLCCGQGRHAVALAVAGCAVTGLDLSQQYLDMAQSEARKAGVDLETVRADMREIPFEGRFDAVVNMFSSFGYLESEEEDTKVLFAVARALQAGGRLLLDLLNREWVIANYEERDWHEDADGTLYLERRHFDLDSSRNHVTFTVITPNGEQREIGGHHIRLYTLREIRGLLMTAGLDFERAYGGFDGEDYSIDARRMIIVARKPA